MSPRTRFARQCALLAFWLLVGLLSLEVWGIVRLELRTRAVLWTVWVLPLLLFLPGLARGAWKSHLWLCFVLMIYFTMTVSELFDPRRVFADWVELVAIVVLFTSSMLYARWRQRELAEERGDNG